MPRLFTYTIPYDDGAAPNPFHGLCTLAICKPGIRRVAKKDDWVAGLGSKNAWSGDLEGHLVYAMKVEEVVSMADYDRLAQSRWPNRVPNPLSLDAADRLGDCIYDFSGGSPPYQRSGVHGPGNVARDLRGENVLIATDFYYFGSRAIPLPGHLRAICHQTQGHRSDSNDEYFDDFIYWLRGLGLPRGQLHGWPDHVVNWADAQRGCGCAARAKGREDDGDC